VIPTICFAQVSTLSKAVRISDSMEPALARLAHRECGGRGVGAIGMCLTGCFALSMALDPGVLTPVLAQSGLPVTRQASNPRH
jgi:dienelactone hydrolase